MDPTSENTTGAAAAGMGKIVAVSLITSLAAGGIAGFGVVYGPELLGKKPAVTETAPAETAGASSMVKPDGDKKPAAGGIADGFRMGTLAPATPIQSIRVTLEVGEGADWNEPVDVHLGTGFPLRLYPVGGESREPSFAAFPTASTVGTGETAVPAGKSATFEFVADEKTKGLDVLRTTPSLMRDLTVGDLQKIGLACQGHSAWKLAGYRVEVNGQLFAEHGGMDLDVQGRIGEVRNELGLLLPPQQALQQQAEALETYVKTGLATDADKAEREKVKAEIAKTKEPVDALMGKVAGYAPWFLEDDAGFKPSPLPGTQVKALKVTLATGGGDQPGTKNPVYLKAGGRKFLLASSADPLEDDPAPQKFQISEADLQAQPLSLDDLKTLGIGVVGNDERFSTVPDRARLQRVLVEADGKTVYDSELKPTDRRTLGTVWLVPPAHLDGSGNVVENTPTPTEVFVWTPGMKPPVDIAAVKPNPVEFKEPAPPPPPPKPGPTPAITGTGDAQKGKKSDVGTTQKGSKKPGPPPVGGRGPGSLAGTSGGFGPVFGPPIRRTGFFPIQQQPVNTLGSLASLAATVINALRPVNTPQVPTLSNARINPLTPIATVGSSQTVQWTVSGNASQVARYRVELFAVLPEQPGPRIVPAPALATNNNVSPVGFPVGGSTTISATVGPISLAGLPATITPQQRLRLWVRPVITAFNARGAPIQTTQGSLLPLFPAATNPNQISLRRGNLLRPRYPGSPQSSALAPSFQLLSPLSGAAPAFLVDPNSAGFNSAWISLPAADPFTANNAWRMIGETDLPNQVLRFAGPEQTAGLARVVPAYNTAARPATDTSGVMLQFEGWVNWSALGSRGFRVVGHAVFLSGSAVPANATVNARLEVGTTAFGFDLDGNWRGGPPIFSLSTSGAVFRKTGAGPQAAAFIDLPFRPDRYAQAATYDVTHGLPAGSFVPGDPSDPSRIVGGGAAPSVAGSGPPPGRVYVVVNIWVQPLNSADATEAVGVMGLRVVPDNT